MVRIAAGRVVALVTCIQTIWNRAKGELIGYAMGIFHLAAYSYYPIAILTRLCTLPRPANVNRKYLN